MADTFRVQVTASSARAAVMAVARELRVSLDEARQLLASARVLPRDLDEASARRLIEELRKAGVRADLVPVVGHSSAVCPAHPSLTPERPCQECRELVCVLCTDARGEPLCARCAAGKARRARAKWVRVGVLLTVLLSIVVWGSARQRRREERLEWKRPLRVAVVVVARDALSPEVREAWRGGVERLGEWMAQEAGRYGLGLSRPVEFTLAMPEGVDEVGLTPPGPSLWERARHAWALSRKLAVVDQAAGLRPDRLDARIYVTLEQAGEEGRFVEGMADEGGMVGLVRGVRGDTELTLELTAVAHEFFHCLGAADAYDADGHAMNPEGLVEPEREPLYPQPAAEVMVGELPLEEGHGRLPTSLDEVRVGPTTARALRWAR